MNYSKLLDKITKAEFIDFPFNYLYIENFIPKDDFLLMINDSQIILEEAKNDIDLINLLQKCEWEPIHFLAVLKKLMTI